jgi:hypothetical protein
MEHFLKWIDDIDDLFAVIRLQAGPLAVTLLLFAVFLVTVGAIFLFGPPDLLAAH